MTKEQAETRLMDFTEIVNTNANSDGLHLLYYAVHPDNKALATAWVSENLENDEQSLLVGFCSLCRVVRDTLKGNFEKPEAEVLDDMVTVLQTAFTAPDEIFHSGEL